jgi:hypothetical protein
MTDELTIILSSVIPGVFVISLVVLLWVWFRRRQVRWLRRGITPIADEEIDSWRTEKHEEHDRDPGTEPESQPSPRRHHRQNSSLASVQKPGSVIVYQHTHNSSISSPALNQGRPSAEYYSSKQNSMDLPMSPVLARAPNARPGLTDEMIQGDDAYIPQLKRQPSKLAKSQPGSAGSGIIGSSRRQQSQHRSARSSISINSSGNGNRDRWYGQQVGDGLTRKSADLPGQRGHERVYSSSANPPRLSLDEATSPGGLSPRPLLHKSEIGRAIG